MSKLTFQSFPYKLVAYGIVPSLCLNASFLTASSVEAQKRLSGYFRRTLSGASS
ncbi:MAG: hypothetical protein HWD61_14495 [Parachlamydiaceae bacterium]|nr:MAG: hypothetical protein HWD61_14495 [Parachlamydiaceae bacterium]